MAELNWQGKDEIRAWLLRSQAGTNLPIGPGFSGVIAGDNLPVLQSLQASYAGQVDVIYADPPYNTGNRHWLYNDDASSPRAMHELQQLMGDKALLLSREDRWLNLMYARFALMKPLLAQSGVLFVSIGEEHMPHMRHLLSELFGPEHFLGTLKWKRKRKPSFLDRHIAVTTEYILVYARDKEQVKPLSVSQGSDTTRPVLNAGNKMVTRRLRAGTVVHQPDGDWPSGTYGARSLTYELLENAKIRDGVLMTDVPVRGPFRVNQTVLDDTVFVSRLWGLRRHVHKAEQKPRPIADLLLDVGTNEDASADLAKNGIAFPFAKPTELILYLLRSTVQNNPNALILDPFAGSGTTLLATWQLNEEDGGKRTTILIEEDENVIDQVLLPRLHASQSAQPFSLCDARVVSKGS